MRHRRPAITIGATILTLATIGGWQGMLQAQTPAVAPVSFASTPSGRGYWVVYSNGLVRGFGDARPYGGAQSIHLREPIVGIAATPSGHGYWLTASDGGVFSFGNTRFKGSLGAIHLNEPIVGMAATPSGRGYWLVASDGGVFSFGDAHFRGSAAVIRLKSPIAAMAPTRDGLGYWLVAQDGGVFSFGQAAFHGSAAGHASAAVTSIAVPSHGHGYWLTANDSHVYGYGAGVYSASALRSRVLVGLVRLASGSWEVMSANGTAVHYPEYFRGSGGRSGSKAPSTTIPARSPATHPGVPPSTSPSTSPSTTPSTTPTTSPGDGSPSPRPTDLGSNIVTYIQQHGDQVLTVPDGTYRAGTVSAPHAATAGKYKGWLVLRAESKDGVVVDLSGSPLTLDATTSRVLFVGFKFINGSLYAYGNNLAFWYTDHSFPAQAWVGQAPDKSHPERGPYRAPRTIYADKQSTQRVSFYGADVHDTGSAFLVSNSTDTLLQGVSAWNMTDDDLDPQDVVHPDVIGGVGGKISGFRVLDSWLRGRIMIQDSKDGTSGGPVDLDFERTWVSNSPSGGFTFTAKRTVTPRGISGRRIDIRSWGHHNGLDRLEIIDGQQIRTSNTIPSRVDVVDSGISTSAPPAGTPSPAQTWRNAHGYDDWASTLF